MPSKEKRVRVERGLYRIGSYYRACATAVRAYAEVACAWPGRADGGALVASSRLALYCSDQRLRACRSARCSAESASAMTKLSTA